MDFREYIQINPCQYVHQSVQERLRPSQELKSITRRPAQNPPHYIPCLAIGRNLSVGDAEANGADMVHHHPHRDGLLLGAPILASILLFEEIDVRTEQVCVVIALLSLECHAEPLESHPCIHV